MKKSLLLPQVLSTALLLTLGATGCQTTGGGSADGLTGAWCAKVQFTSGSFAGVKDLELMYAFNAGGTMTESSSYDAAPPVPPAYGVWRKVGEGKYEARYEYFWTKSPVKFDEIAKGGGWLPGGHGVLMEKITLSADGNTYDSAITYEAFDEQGKSPEGAWHAVGKGARIKF